MPIAQLMPLPVHWPYHPAIERLSLALALGLFVGLERQWRRKEAGLRVPLSRFPSRFPASLRPAFPLPEHKEKEPFRRFRITPASKFRMLPHTNPTRERGECLGTRAGASEDM